MKLLTDVILQAAREFIPQHDLRDRKSTHPWMNNEVLDLVTRKHAAVGTSVEDAARDACSQGIMVAFSNYVQEERDALLQLRRASKSWWTKIRRLLHHQGKTSSVPALKDESKRWVIDSASKADLFVDTLSKKFKLAGAEINDYTAVESTPFKEQGELMPCKERDAEKTLNYLREESGTGPDALPARILKHCASSLAKLVRLLVDRIIESGMWPQLWIMHWIVPLHKKKGVYDPKTIAAST